MDSAHFEILQTATDGRARTVWGYMDQQFSDQISTVPFPAPVPPNVTVRRWPSAVIVSHHGHVHFLRL